MVSLLMIVAGSFSAGCGPKQDPLIGIWCDSDCNQKEFRADGTGELSKAPGCVSYDRHSISFRWKKLANESLQVEYEMGPPKTEVFKFVIEGDSATLTPESGKVVKFDRRESKYGLPE